MNENDEPQQFFPDNNKEQLFVEVPPSLPTPYNERIPSGYDPMGEIYLRGRTYRSLSGGRIPWWVLMSGWFIFGGMALMILVVMITSKTLAPLPLLVFAAIPILIVWRGTLRKFSSSKQSRRR